MNYNKLSLGKKGEEKAKKFLRKQGYRIIETNYRSPLGEIDIVAEEKNTLCFVEVKTRLSREYGLPEEAVNWHKKRKLTKLALAYLLERKIREREIRFDVVSVYRDRLELIKNAFLVEKDFY